jgi:hypothetical protein
VIFPFALSIYVDTFQATSREENGGCQEIWTERGEREVVHRGEDGVLLY